MSKVFLFAGKHTLPPPQEAVGRSKKKQKRK